ncbi:MAG: M23 family metallopeptidase [Sphingopyxis sp.]|nr:M23 family metallopeptidase [Sphingopyxis sp.]
MLMGTNLPAAYAAEAAAEIGVDGPEEEFANAESANAAAIRADYEARSIFRAWRQLDTGMAATSAIAVPSRKPIDAMKLSSAYGMRVHPVTGRLARHNGIDIPAPHGTPIYATADGIVGRAQRLGGYGLYVEVEHGNNIQTRYGHMSSYAVTSGQRVKKGDIIGYVGSTGRSTGNHLHYEVRIAGTPVNPLPFVESGELALAALADADTAMGGPE